MDIQDGSFCKELQIHVYVWLSPSAVHLKLSQHCSLAMLQYKIKSLIKKTKYKLLYIK